MLDLGGLVDWGVASSTRSSADSGLTWGLFVQIDLRNHYTDVTINVELEALKDSDEVVLCGPWNLWSNAAHLLVMY